MVMSDRCNDCIHKEKYNKVDKWCYEYTPNEDGLACDAFKSVSLATAIETIDNASFAPKEVDEYEAIIKAWNRIKEELKGH